MSRLCKLLLLSMAFLVMAGAPAFAAEPPAGPDLCAAPVAPAPSFLSVIDPPDFILCTCSYCKHHPDVICQISPSGFSIVCQDYYDTRC